MRLIFVRHGQTQYNAVNRYQGQSDAVLSSLGRLQAECTGERLRQEDVAAIYSSDLSRALDTAKVIARHHNLPVSLDARLRECSFGDWEGLTVQQIVDRFPDQYAAYRRDSVAFRAPNGERLEELQTRVVESVNSIVEHHSSDENIVVVTHGGPIKAFFCHALGTTLYTFRVIRLDNCSITVFALQNDGRWFLEVLNDTCHLRTLEHVNRESDRSSEDKAP